MSRSYRKSYRTTICCCTPDSVKRWKDGYNRNIRRTTRHLINMLDLDNIEDDETYFPTDPETDSARGNLWECGDGFDFYPDVKEAAEIRHDKPWHIACK